MDLLVYQSGDFEWFEKKHRTPGLNTGKYLLFSQDREILCRIAREAVGNGDFDAAKVVVEEARKDDYVLCLYSPDDFDINRVREKYGHRPGVDFRGWKSDKDTLAGHYSERYWSHL